MTNAQTPRKRYTYKLRREDGSTIRLSAFYTEDEWVARIDEHIANGDEPYGLQVTDQ